MKVAIVLGTRPEIIKMSPLIRELQKRNISHFILHTGQHYDYRMDKIFFEELELTSRVIHLDIGSGLHGEMTGKMMIKIEQTLLTEKPSLVFVQGDTNTVLAASLVAVKLHIPLAHVEAGLRSYDRRMPEEYNRIIADHIADYLFTATPSSEKTLLGEGIPNEHILITGNTIVDALYQSFPLAKQKSTILENLSLTSGKYFLVTFHRPENVDSKETLLNIIKGLTNIAHHFKLPLIIPIHPRTKKRIDEFKLTQELSSIKNLKIIDPLGFLDLLMLESNALLVLTDSGGIQEECCVLKVPCIVMRKTTDRPESIHIGAALLSGTDPKRILNCTQQLITTHRDWNNPYGDGNASKLIVDFLQSRLQKV